MNVTTAHYSVLINSSPQVMLLTLDLHEYFGDEKCISKSLTSTLQALDIFGSKLVTPQTNRRMAHLKYLVLPTNLRYLDDYD